MAGGRPPVTLSLSPSDPFLSSYLPSPPRKTAVFLLILAFLYTPIPSLAAFAGPTGTQSAPSNDSASASSRGVRKQRHGPSRDFFSSPSSPTRLEARDRSSAPSVEERSVGFEKGGEHLVHSRKPGRDGAPYSATGNQKALRTKKLREGSFRKSRKHSRVRRGSVAEESPRLSEKQTENTPLLSRRPHDRVDANFPDNADSFSRGSRSIAKRRAVHTDGLDWQPPLHDGSHSKNYGGPQGDLIRRGGEPGPSPSKLKTISEQLSTSFPVFGLADGDETGGRTAVGQRETDERGAKQDTTGPFRTSWNKAKASMEALFKPNVEDEAARRTPLTSDLFGQNFAVGSRDSTSPNTLPFSFQQTPGNAGGGSFSPDPHAQGGASPILAGHIGGSADALLALLARDSENNYGEPRLSPPDLEGKPAFWHPRDTRESGEYELKPRDEFPKLPASHVPADLSSLRPSSPSAAIPSPLTEHAYPLFSSPAFTEAAQAPVSGSTWLTNTDAPIGTYRGVLSEEPPRLSTFGDGEPIPSTDLPGVDGKYPASFPVRASPLQPFLRDQAEKAAKVLRELSSSNPLPPELDEGDVPRGSGLFGPGPSQQGENEHLASPRDSQTHQTQPSILPQEEPDSGAVTERHQRTEREGDSVPRPHAVTGETPDQDSGQLRTQVEKGSAQTPHSEQQPRVAKFRMGPLKSTSAPGTHCFVAFLSALSDESQQQNLLGVAEQDAELTETLAALSDTDDGRPFSSFVPALAGLGFALRRLGVPKNGEAVFKVGILARKFRYLLEMYAERLSTGIYRRDAESVGMYLTQEVSDAFHSLVEYFEIQKDAFQQSGVPGLDQLFSDITLYQRVDKLLGLYCPPYVDMVQHEDGSSALDFSLLHAIHADPSARKFKRQGLLDSPVTSLDSGPMQGGAKASRRVDGEESRTPAHEEEDSRRRRDPGRRQGASEENTDDMRLLARLLGQERGSDTGERQASKLNKILPVLVAWEKAKAQEEAAIRATLLKKEGHPTARQAGLGAVSTMRNVREDKAIAAPGARLDENRVSSRVPSGSYKATVGESYQTHPLSSTERPGDGTGDVSPAVLLRSGIERTEGDGREQDRERRTRSRLPGSPSATAQNSGAPADGDNPIEATDLPEREQNKTAKQRQKDKRKKPTKTLDRFQVVPSVSKASTARAPGGPREGAEDFSVRTTQQASQGNEREREIRRPKDGKPSRHLLRKTAAAPETDAVRTATDLQRREQHAGKKAQFTNDASKQDNDSSKGDSADKDAQTKSKVKQSTSPAGFGKQASSGTIQVRASHAVFMTSRELAFPRATATLVVPPEQAAMAQRGATVLTGTGALRGQAAPENPKASSLPARAGMTSPNSRADSLA
ncbi:putative platelet binding protein GspB [Neospora caninum Liverpool]|uniref:Platelet binding protein GspB, putative n=1 Tax=Neospora caninum (strain Liverpool) TaxID=572307 RepID=F0VMF4_NEOCL|nr:putative platelet binding protein GspB [Neospora caninum Liverpool]CBZ54900.1 putative platelet binding protein GspB [Neospora caninum Liverpool]CEL69621.1 TPA: platelet binding protein GspB, putative [Neospora caninum Liverpool]|eukprot:XP_003884928.1 putative platelet binding protein GspB [Neospora caninum Liverpool]